MSKAPEEGDIWEWRAFGRVSKELAKKVSAYPVRMGALDIPGEDLYLVSPVSDQNIKLRRAKNQWVLKFKLLLAKGPRAIELYSETSRMVFKFPVDYSRLEETASLLQVTPVASRKSELNDEEFTEALMASSPAVIKTLVTKKRSQFNFGVGWVELAEVNFPHKRLESISIHSSNLEAVEEILAYLNPPDEIEPMNYVQACRMWG